MLPLVLQMTWLEGMISRIFLFTLLDKRDWHWLYVRMNFKYHFLKISFSTKPTKRGRYQTSRDCCTPGRPVPSVHLHLYLLVPYLIAMFLLQGLSAQGLATPNTLMSISSACLPTVQIQTKMGWSMLQELQLALSRCWCLRWLLLTGAG